MFEAQDPVNRALQDSIGQRERHGKQKYGVTVSDNPLSLAEWLRHARDESLDHAVYTERAARFCEVWDEVWGALRELVAVKGLRDKIKTTRGPINAELFRECEQREPLAWNRARKALEVKVERAFLPPHKSVWETKEGFIFVIIAPRDGFEIELSQPGVEVRTVMDASGFREWVEDNKAVCRYDPTKVPPCEHPNIAYTPDPSGNNDVTWSCADCRGEWDRDPRGRR